MQTDSVFDPLDSLFVTVALAVAPLECWARNEIAVSVAFDADRKRDVFHIQDDYRSINSDGKTEFMIVIRRAAPPPDPLAPLFEPGSRKPPAPRLSTLPPSPHKPAEPPASLQIIKSAAKFPAPPPAPLPPLIPRSSISILVPISSA